MQELQAWSTQGLHRAGWLAFVGAQQHTGAAQQQYTGWAAHWVCNNTLGLHNNTLGQHSNTLGQRNSTLGGQHTGMQALPQTLTASCAAGQLPMQALA